MNGESYEEAIGSPQGDAPVEEEQVEETAPEGEAQEQGEADGEERAAQPVAVTDEGAFPTRSAPAVSPGGQPYPVEESSFQTVGIAGRNR